ncbi:hypothetical protein Pcinc_038567 [Petrolisthes cinctipes]|uniref:Uncharacterized protein n=1 Tax=Petrolisthes cinctipes TaxID=88211 RepID=A0AAE1EK70_PETCI|nr:hypothetical protein Pcinc_038567 [Petrolisthes cinctipes]
MGSVAGWTLMFYLSRAVLPEVPWAAYLSCPPSRTPCLSSPPCIPDPPSPSLFPDPATLPLHCVPCLPPCHLFLTLCSLLPPCLLAPATLPLHCVPCCLPAFSSLPPLPYTVFLAASLPSRPCHPSLTLCSLLPPCLLVPATPPLHCVPCLPASSPFPVVLMNMNVIIFSSNFNATVSIFLEGVIKVLIYLYLAGICRWNNKY